MRRSWRPSSRARGAAIAFLLAGCAVERPASPAPGQGTEATSGGCLRLALRITGEARGGELGFRFGPPRDVDGDGIADIAAGARFTNLEFTGMGTVAVWSTDGGREIARWEGHAEDALFGQCALAGPDADGDGLADIIASAPNGRYHDVQRGVIYARSPVTKRLNWSAVGEAGEGIGWHMALAGDQDGDGVADIFAGLPGGGITGKVYLLSGRDGSVLRIFASHGGENDQFGWYVAALPDLDGDGREDLLTGAPSAECEGVGRAGAVYAFSSATGEVVRAWYGHVRNGMFGDVVAALPDLDGDGAAEVVVGAPYRSLDGEEPLPGEVFVFSGASGAVLRHWLGRQPGELYGRMVASVGDADGDGTGDIAVGAPWHRSRGREKAGRFELRSGRTGEPLAQVEGEREGMWLGWHIEAGENLGRERRRGLVVSALRSEERDLPGAGALLVYYYSRP